jgi:hypothetical protein
MWPTLAIKWVSDALPAGLKRLGRENYHTLAASTDIKNAWKYIYTLA